MTINCGHLISWWDKWDEKTCFCTNGKKTCFCKNKKTCFCRKIKNLFLLKWKKPAFAEQRFPPPVQNSRWEAAFLGTDILSPEKIIIYLYYLLSSLSDRWFIYLGRFFDIFQFVHLRFDGFELVLLQLTLFGHLDNLALGADLKLNLYQWKWKF